MTKSEYADLTYFMIYRYKLVKNSEFLMADDTMQDLFLNNVLLDFCFSDAFVIRFNFYIFAFKNWLPLYFDFSKLRF